MKKISRRSRLLLATGLSILCICYILWTVRQSNQELRAEFLFDAEIVANKLNVKQIEQLSFSLKDIQLPEFKQLNHQLRELAAGFQVSWRPAYGQINLYTMRSSSDGIIRFGPESIQENNYLASPPGKIYKTPPPELQKAFATRHPMIVGPFHNENGSFITALVPLHGLTETIIVGVDVNMDNWKIAVLQKAAIPIGITLILLIFIISAMSLLLHVDASPKPVMRRLLPALATMLILLFAGGLLLFLHQYRNTMDEQNDKIKESITTELSVDIKSQSLELAMALRFIKSDPLLQQALHDGNRQQLLASSRSLFETFFKELKITHFYFFDRNRTCILRLQEPEKYGDRVDRFTLIKAESTGKTVSGLELGSRGTFALRVVQPVFKDGVVVGYVELGKEIDDLFQARHASTGCNLAIVIRKEFVKRQLWEEYMRQMGREVNWDLLPDGVIIYNSLGKLPEAIVSIAAQNNKSRQDLDTCEDIFSNGKNLHTDIIPLHDASGKNIGSMLIINDVTKAQTSFQQILLIAIILTVVILTAIFCFVFVLLRRTDAGIDAQHKTLRESEELFRGLFDNHAAVKLIIDHTTGNIINANHAAEKYYGWTKEQLLKMKIQDINTMSEAEIKNEMNKAAAALKNSFEFRHRLANGSIRDVMVFSANITVKDKQCLHSIVHDVTENKQVEDALNESRKRFETLAEQAGTIVWEVNSDGLYTFVSPLVEKITGYGPDEITGKLHFYDLHPAEGREEFKAAAFAVLEKQEQIINLEKSVQTKDGHVIWVATNALPVFNIEGNIRGYRGSDTDITERKNAALALQASEEKWRTMIDTSPDGVTILSFDGTLLFVSEKMVKMLGYASAEEIIGRNMSEFLDESYHEKAVSTLAEVVKGNHVGIKEFLLIRKDGTCIFIELNPEILHDNKETGSSIFFAARDITERKRTEAQLHKLNRTYALQSDINVNILHENEPQVLFDNICRIAVTTGGFHMAWLSMIDPESGSVKAVASAGNTGNYLEKFNFVPDGNSELNRGPTADALFSGKCSAVNDIEHDPRMAPWRENALRLGYRSAAVFPLTVAGKVCGTLNLYSNEVNFFDIDELKLLNEIAKELAFAIDYNENEKNRKQVIAELQETKALLQAAFDQSLVGIAIADAADGTLRYVNKAGRMIRGESKTEIVNNLFKEEFIPSWQFQHHDGTPLTTNELPLAQVIKSGKPCQAEYVIVRDDGGKRTVMSNASPIFDESGKVKAGIAVFQDITMQKQAEQAMAEHAERLERAVKERTTELQLYAMNLKLLSEATEQSPTAVVIADIHGNIEFVNPRFTEITGYAMEEVIGQNPRILKSGQTPPLHYVQMWQTIISGKIWRGEFCNRRKNGELYWERAIISPVRNDQQEIISFVAVKEDITQERKIRTALEYAEERNRLLLESAGVGIFGVDPEGKVVFINSSACQMFGCEPKDLLGEKIHEKAHYSRIDGSLYPIEECPMHHAYISGIATNVENELMFRRNKEPFYVDYHATPIIKNDVIVGAVISFQDVSERKRTADELAAARRHADDANVAKGQFLANMSHEIRTPMNAILGMTYLALETELTPKQQDYLQKINIVSKTLLKIISDVLDFSKIESGMLEISTIPFMLEDVIRNSVMLIGFTAEEKGIEVEIDVDWTIPYMLNGDPARLGQILNNLLSNAVKFTREGEILLSVQATRRIQNKIELEFSVKDTGIGIAPENKVKLFKSFTQADESITRQYGGTGLGLAISRQLLGLMGGGEIQLESTPGKGSVFSFKVIFGIPPNSKPAIERLHLDSALRGTQTLLVSTNETSCNITRKTLEAMHFKTATASSAVQAFEKITDADKNNKPFGLIIIDWWPSDINEIEAARHIRQMHLSNSPRLLLISSRKHELDEVTVHEAGFSICINRPVHASTLFNAIMQAFHGVIAAGKVPAKHHKELKDVKILLAEDNEFNRQVELELLQSAGAIVSVVYNGIEAVEAVKTQDFDIVLMDVQMPEMDGLTATRNIRNLDKPGIATLPILAMTANVLKQDIEDCLAAGMNNHIIKPIDPAEMLAVLSDYITPKNGAVKDANTVSGRRHDENIVLPHSRPELDVAIGLSHIGGSKVFYRDMLRKFVRDFAGAGTVISADLKSGKNQDALRLAHTVKSAAGTIGALKLFSAAMELENTLHSDPATATSSLSRFKTQLKELIAILRNEEALHPEKDSATKTPAGPGDFNYLKKVIAELEILAEKRLPQPCRKIMNSLLAFEWPPAFATVIHEMNNMFARYHFDEVSGKLEELRKLSEQKNNLTEEDSSHDITS